MKMIDFHTHILPRLDDGSKNTGESIELLRLLADQGVTDVFATPHFYASDHSPDHFFAKRKEAYDRLAEVSEGQELPKVRMGAEVSYFHGISSSSVLLDMRLEQTEILLLEMPTEPWTDYLVRELTAISCLPNVKLLLAHIERYFPYTNMKTLDYLIDRGVITQANASSFLKPLGAHKMIKLLHSGHIHMVASDCHSVNQRPPQLDKARRVISKKLGESALRKMDEFGESLLLNK